MFKLRCFAVIGLLGLLAVCGQAAPIVFSDGFESGDLALWTVSSPSGYTNATCADPAGANTGSCYAQFGDTPGSISTTLPTIAGNLFQLVFFLAPDQFTAPTDSFQALWNGVVINDLTGDLAAGYLQYTATVSGQGADTLSFVGSNAGGFFHLDDVSVEQVDQGGAVPEPATFVLLGSALLGLGLLRRRR